MKEIKHFNLKRFFSLFACLCLAFCLAFTVACGGGNNSSSSSSSSSSDDDAEVSVTDYQSIKNGDFEFGTSAKNVSYPVYTGINWTKYRDNSYSTSAVSSTKNSGIIDTEDEAYAKIAETNNFPKNDDDTYWNPKTPESYGLGGERYVYDKETYESNPNEDKLVTSGSKILMIHNVTSVAGRGTAQKFVSSSSLTTTTGYGKISVWVNTKDLKSLQKDQPFGAYISVNNTLSSTRAPFVIKSIDTKGVWANYVIYLVTSDYAKSSYTVTVGLGFGSDTYKAEYVEGFAYFDEIHYEEIDKETFETETAEKDGSFNLFNDDGTEVDKESLKINESGKTYSSNEGKNVTTVKYVYSHLMKSDELTLNFTGEYNKVYQHNPEEYAKGATSGIKAFNEIESVGVTNPYGETAQTAFIKLSSPSSYTITSQTLLVKKGERKQFNFLTNVSVKLAGQPGAKIDLEEVKDASASEVFETVSVASDYNTYSTEKHEHTWKKVSVFVENDTDQDRYIRFKFTLGTTDNVFDAADYNLTEGYALFTGFNERLLPENEYDNASSEADYKSTVTLGYEFPNGPATDDDETENFAFTATTSTKQDLTYKPATGVQGYTGVVGNHTMTGGNQNAYSADNVISGVISGKNASSYHSDILSDDEKALIDSLRGGENIQPLLIKNVTSACYGYLGSQLTFSANTTTLVSVQVKVADGATAFVYLANADPLSYFGVLKVAESPLCVKVTKDSAPTTDKWVTVNFVITTGDQDITYRVELWNGSRDGEIQSQGTVLFNTVATSSSVNVTELKARMQAEFASSPSDVKETSYTRAPATVKYTDADGNDVTYTRTFDESVVMTEYVKGSTVFASYETIDAPTEIDETTSTDDDSDSSSDSSTVTDNTETANWALQLTSIIIAAVLVVVLAIVIIRMIVKKNKKAEIATGNFYNRDSREKAQAQINANKAKRAQQAATETKETTGETKEQPEEKPYDYDNPENNV